MLGKARQSLWTLQAKRHRVRKWLSRTHSLWLPVRASWLALCDAIWL